MTVFDNADWHCGHDFPADLPTSAAATHIGMYLAWCAQAGLLRSDDTIAQSLKWLKEVRITPGAFARLVADGVLSSDLLTEGGLVFTEKYYGAPEDDLGDECFEADYAEVFWDSGETIFHVPDTWESFAKISPVIESRFNT